MGEGDGGWGRVMGDGGGRAWRWVDVRAPCMVPALWAPGLWKKYAV